MVNFTIQNVLIPSGQHYETVDVQIGGDSPSASTQISAIAPHLPAVGTVVDGRNKLLLPGFVNAHTHSPEMWQRGRIPPLPLELWIAELYDFPHLTPEQVYLSALGTAVETLLSGGTTVVDHFVPIPGQELESLAAAVRGYREIGIRAVVGLLIHDQSLPEGVPTGGESLKYASHIHTMESLINLMGEAIAAFHHPTEGIHIMVSPTGLQLCSDELMAACIDFSDRYHLCRHTHLLETKAQALLAQERYGCSAVAHLNQIGFLGSRTSLAHCVWLDDDDIQLLGATQSTVVHNPLSNLRLGSGIAPILKCRQAGVNVAFGCDGAASNDAQDMLEVLKMGSLLHNTTTFEYQQWITPQETLTMASLGGAIGLGLEHELGSLTVGKQADLVLYDLTDLSLLPRTNPLGLLLLGRPNQVVDSVWVRGKRVVMNKQVVTIDVAQLRQKLFEQSQWTNDLDSPSRSAVESRYRRVMGLPNRH